MISTHDFIFWVEKNGPNLTELKNANKNCQNIQGFVKKILLSCLVYKQIWLNIFWMIASLATSPTCNLRLEAILFCFTKE
jgi:hypothetical protein